jgi:2-haloacid dehalogenase
MMEYTHILFDVDGTLFDFDKAQEHAFEKTFKQCEVDYQPEYHDLYREINARVWEEYENGEIDVEQVVIQRFERLFQALGVDLNSQDFNASYLEHLSERDDLLEGAEELILELSGRYTMMLVTNGLAIVQRRRVLRSPLYKHFTGIVISEEVGSTKPDARIFEVALVRLGNPDKRQVLMVGDSLNADIRGANQAGIDACWFNPNGQGVPEGVAISYRITSLAQLADILEVR